MAVPTCKWCVAKAWRAVQSGRAHDLSTLHSPLEEALKRLLVGVVVPVDTRSWTDGMTGLRKNLGRTRSCADALVLALDCLGQGHALPAPDEDFALVQIDVLDTQLRGLGNAWPQSSRADKW